MYELNGELVQQAGCYKGQILAARYTDMQQNYEWEQLEQSQCDTIGSKKGPTR